MRSWFHTLAVVAAAGLTGCAFDADYAGTSLRCPASSPRCPDGYTCVDEVCTRAGATDAGDGDGDAPDASGADAGVCDLAAAEGTRDTCGQARDLTAAASAAGGTRVHGNTTGYANDLTPSTLPDCTTSPEPGSDGIWRITVTAGQTLAVTFSPEGWSGDVYIVDACTATATCEGGGPMFSSVSVTPAAGTYYIVVDARTPSEAGCYHLDVALTP
ncbi:MAG: hypothetical protein K8M05_42070 [Deltaproteobacteria bacterium]|nr:hypothetical protein [Kofleriaceae bacterium]